jgi:iron(III) transport system substrate-binding protein
LVGYFQSGLARAFIDILGVQDVVDWGYIGDGTPLVPRGMGLTTGAESPFSAMLMIDYILSQEGQTAVCSSSIVAYRDDVDTDVCGFYTVESIVEAVGEENTFVMPYINEVADKRQEITDRWNDAFGR